jgi:hypothetical protein
MEYGMITLQNNDDTRPRRKYGGKIKLKPITQWGARQGHKEDRADTSFDNRPKRKRTRKDIERGWRDEYDI